MEMHFATVWESLADTIGDETALVHGDVRRTWREYDERAARLAAAFTDAGLEPGTRVGLLMYNGNEYLEAQFATLKQRLVPINVNYRYLDDELVYLLDNADCQALVFHTSLAERVARVVPRLPDAAAADRGRRRRRRSRASTGRWPIEDVIADTRAGAAHRARRGRLLHALHRRHHGHAQGRDLRHRRHDRVVHRELVPGVRA